MKVTTVRHVDLSGHSTTAIVTDEAATHDLPRVLEALGVPEATFTNWEARGYTEAINRGRGRARQLESHDVLHLAVLAVATEMGVRLPLAAAMARKAAEREGWGTLLHASGPAVWFEGEAVPDDALPGGRITLRLPTIVRLARGAVE